MQSLEQCKSLLRQLFSPVVMVIASEKADELCRSSNGLTVDELLRPFGVLKQLNGGLGVPVRTVAEQSLRLHNWLLRFYSGSNMFQPAPQAADAYLSGMLTQVATLAGGSVPELQQLIDNAHCEDPTPWYTEYRQEYLRMLAFGPHETMDHPVACLLVLPSTCEGGAASYDELFERGMPPSMRQGGMEPRILRHHVLLHDARHSSQEALVDAKQRTQQMSAELGHTCHLLVINSGDSSGVPGATPMLWQEALRGVVPGGGAGEPASRPSPASGGLGAGLTQHDVANLASFVQEFAVRSIVPHVESRIRALDQAATVARRGLRNQLKSLLFRKAAAPSQGEGIQRTSSNGVQPPSADSAASAGGSVTPAASYPHFSIEAQLRQLSDLCMMVGDYETALSTLRLLATDFKGDKAYKHYAGVQEAMAAATVLSDGSPTDAIAHFREAFHRYNSLSQYNPADSGGVRYATRVAMWLAAYFGAIDRHADASWIAMKAHFQEDDLRSGLLLESTAHSLLRLRPPQVRKFAFHLVLAGLRYNQGGQRALAQRVYAQALAIYAGRGWAMVEEHVREALGKGCEEDGDAEGALRHFAATLLCPQISQGMQRLHMEQFTHALQRTTADLGYSPAVDLPLPVIDVQQVGLAVAGQASYANIEARQVPQEYWVALESALQPTSDGGPTWLDGNSRSNLSGQAERHSCCVGEDVGLDVSLTNPLHLPLAVTRLRVVCEFEPAASGAGSAGTSAAAPGGSTRSEPLPPFQVWEERVTLHGGERAVVHLRVRPLRPGMLRVEGVAWVLNGAAHGQRRFEVPRPRPRKPGSSAILLDAERPAPGALAFTVLPPMPKMEAMLEGLPQTMLEGQVVLATLRLKNTGAMSLHGMCMAGSGEMFVAGSDGSGAASSTADSSSAAVAEQSRSKEQTAPAATLTMRQGVGVFSLDPTIKLGVNEQLCLPVWFRPTRPGPTRFNCAWRYEPVVKLDALRFRTLRASFTATTLPSLQLSAAVLPAATPGVYLLQLRGLNLQGLETFSLTSLSVLGGAWNVCQLQQESEQVDRHQRTSALDVELAPEAAAGLHFHLTPPDSACAIEGQAELPAAEAYLCGIPVHAAASADSADRKQQQQQQQKRTKGIDRQGSAAHAAPPPQPLDVAVKWHATSVAMDRAAAGVHVVRLTRFQTGPPVHMQLTGPPAVTHDFTQSAICLIDLVLQLRNMLPMPAAVQVDTGHYEDGSVVAPGVTTWSAPAQPAHEGLPHGPSSADLGSHRTAQPPRCPTGLMAGASPARTYVWCGRTRVTLPSVPAGRAVDVRLRVAVTAPGWLALADYVVSWCYEDVPQTAGSSQGPACFIHVGTPHGN